MEIGAITMMRSKFLNESVAVVNSVRKVGFVYKFVHRRDNQYRCCRCKQLGKNNANHHENITPRPTTESFQFCILEQRQYSY